MHLPCLCTVEWYTDESLCLSLKPECSVIAYLPVPGRHHANTGGTQFAAGRVRGESVRARRRMVSQIFLQNLELNRSYTPPTRNLVYHFTRSLSYRVVTRQSSRGSLYI